MTVKINIDRLSSPDLIRTDRQRDVKAATKDVGVEVNKRSAVSEDQLDISSRAVEVGSLVEQLKSLPDVRQERVDVLRQQILAGTYRPSGDEIADAILKDDRS